MKNFKMKKAIINRVEEINAMLPKINELDYFVTTYDGGTFPYYIILTKPIEIKNQYVYIYEKQSRNIPCDFYNFEKRYNANSDKVIGGYDDLLYSLNLIRKEFKKALKNA